MYFLFAWRYFKAKKNTNAINIISWITACVIGFSTMCQVLVLSVFNGFEDLVKSLYSNFYPDVKVIPATGKTATLSLDSIERLKAVPGVSNISFVIEEKALVQSGEQQTVVVLKGVDDNYRNVTSVPEKVVRGSFNTGTAASPLLILGVGIESALDVQSDKNLEPLTIFLPSKGNGRGGDPMASITEGNANTSGSFAIQQDFDNKYVITNLNFVKQQMKLRVDEFTAIEIKIGNAGNANGVVKSLQQQLGNKFRVLTKYEQNASLYSSMTLEKWAVFAVLTLILIIAAFNMISALTMLVLEKQKDISVLQSLGADRSLIKKIFLSEGLILAGIGSGSGVVLALLIGVFQLQFKFIKLSGNSFLIDYFPVKFIATDFFLVAATSFVISFVASWIPAQKASNQQFQLKT